MSPAPLNRLLNAGGDLILHPWLSHSPWPSLIAGSVGAAAAMVLLFSLTSNQALLRRRRNQLFARTLELLLFRHDARVSLTACGRILKANAAYLGTFLKPTAVALIPMCLILIQLAAWFEFRPLRTGESAILTVKLDQDVSVLDSPAELRLADSLVADGAPVRIPRTNEICWRILVKSEAEAWAEIRYGSAVERKDIAAGPQLTKISSQRVSPGIWQELLHPVELPLSADGPMERIEVTFPERILRAGDFEVHWLAASFIIIMVAGLLIGKIAGVSIT